jgi:hypothetical protein
MMMMRRLSFLLVLRKENNDFFNFLFFLHLLKELLPSLIA